MINAAPHFKMGFINIAAGSIQLLISRQSNCNLLSIGKPEKLIVAAVNETNILAGFLDVLIQPFGYITEAVVVVVALLRIAADQEFPLKVLSGSLRAKLTMLRLSLSKPYSSERRALITSSNSALNSSVFKSCR